MISAYLLVGTGWHCPTSDRSFFGPARSARKGFCFYRICSPFNSRNENYLHCIASLTNVDSFLQMTFWNVKRKTLIRVKRSKKQQLGYYKPSEQMTLFTSSLQCPPIPHRADEGPLICFPLPQEKLQTDPYLWLSKTQCSGQIRTSFIGERFWHVTPLKEEQK